MAEADFSGNAQDFLWKVRKRQRLLNVKTNFKLGKVYLMAGTVDVVIHIGC